MSKKWYVIYTKAKMEEVASLNLQNQEFETYLPTIESVKKRKNKKVLCTESLFPRYMFISLDLGVNNTAPIRSTRGVTKLVGFDGLPMAVPTEFIQSLQQTEKQRVIADAVLNKPLTLGDTVEVLDGPFNGFIGQIQRISGKHRVSILMGILGKENCLEFDVNDVFQIAV